MSHHAETLDRTGSLTPVGMARQLHASPTESSVALNWSSVTLQRFKFQSHYRVDLPEMRDYVIALQLAGPVYIEEEAANGGVYRRWFEPGTMNLIPPGQTSRRSLKGCSDVLTLSISPTVMDEVFAESFDRDPAALSLRPRLAASDEVIRHLGFVLMREIENGKPASLMAETITRAIALQLIRAHSNHTCASGQPAPSLPAGRMQRVVEYMRTHLEEDIGLNELAALAGLGKSQFAKAFREATGSSPHRFLISLRIEKARDLLERSGKPVIEIAMTCGFSHPAHFATAFRKLSGLSPRAWRLARTR